MKKHDSKETTLQGCAAGFFARHPNVIYNDAPIFIPGPLINHSRLHANAVAIRVKVEGFANDIAVLKATRHIAPNEEIFFAYGACYFDGEQEVQLFFLFFLCIFHAKNDSTLIQACSCTSCWGICHCSKCKGRTFHPRQSEMQTLAKFCGLFTNREGEMIVGTRRSFAGILSITCVNRNYQEAKYNEHMKEDKKLVLLMASVLKDNTLKEEKRRTKASLSCTPCVLNKQEPY